jgi:hypothetical protein
MKDNTKYDTFLSHSHLDAEVVELIATKLEDEHGLNIWLDKWLLIPGEPFRQALSKGLDEAKTCLIIIGSTTPKGWFEEEVTKALDKQTRDRSFRVIPVLLPSADPNFITDFLELRTWVKFKENINELRAFHEMVCGINGVPPERKYCEPSTTKINLELKGKLKQINELFDDNLIEESVKIEFQKTLIQEHIIFRKNEK